MNLLSKKVPYSPISFLQMKLTGLRQKYRALYWNQCRKSKSLSVIILTNLDEPFLVMATQNPIEQEGTYPLPEAQVDRFMLKVKISYPQKEEEKLIIRQNITNIPEP